MNSRQSKDYRDIVLDRIEKSFDYMLIPGIVVSLLTGFVLIYYAHNYVMGVASFVITFSNIILLIYRKLFFLKIKIIFTIVELILVGNIGIFVMGIDSGGLTLFIIANLLACILLEFNISIFISFITAILYLIQGLIKYNVHENNFTELNFTEWMIELMLFMIFIFIIQAFVYEVRKYLTENMHQLNKNADLIKKMAYYDQLTKLPNLYYLKEQLEADRKEVEYGCIVYFSIKNLTLINTMYGSKTGDKVIIEFGERIRRLTKPETVVARVGGNEFVIWAKNITEEEFLDRYYKKVSQNVNDVKIRQLNKKLEFYAGYAVYEQGVEIFETMENARVALTVAKKYRILNALAYCQQFSVDIIRQEEAKELLAVAINREEFVIYYQTKVDAFSEKIVGVEALARWDNSPFGLRSPGEFIPIIEQMNKSIEFGEMIVRKVLSDFEKLKQKYGADVFVSINISPSHLMNTDFVANLEAELKRFKIDPSKIILEITEDVMIEGLPKVKKIITNIKSIGVKVSIDDFGTGYSSLSYLLQLDVDELKIDRSFISELDNEDFKNEKNRILVKTIIALANQLRMPSVAEGVETEKQRDKVKALGCPIIQGFLYSRPEKLES